MEKKLLFLFQKLLLLFQFLNRFIKNYIRNGGRIKLKIYTT